MVHLAKLIISFCLFEFGTIIQAQNTIPATGGNASGTGGNFSYTIGQVAYMTIPGINGTVTQGVQQPYEISIVTELEEAKDINLICSVFPNPTNNLLTLKVDVYENTDFSYWLYGVSGNLIETKKVFSNETQINLGNQVSGSYFLKITSGKKEIKTFKVIKN
jgi:hypothetical protein